MNRILTWDGCQNVRDLGGLSTRTSSKTRWGAVVRSDHPARLTPAGWAALYAHGIRTIISLRTDGQSEDVADIAARPPDIVSLQLAIEDITDADFVQKWVATDLWCTPIYYSDALRRWPERHVAVIRAIAQAQPGGVLFHCRRGNDRTGIIALLLLALVGVLPEEIAADYELSPDPDRAELLARQHTNAHDVIISTVEQLDAPAYLRAGGLSDVDLAAVRARLL
jgi:protein-tyrosine phosphatase